MSEDHPDADLPWYRQFWPWFLIALPLAVVIASGVTIYLAAAQPLEIDPAYQQRDGNDDDRTP